MSFPTENRHHSIDRSWAQRRAGEDQRQGLCGVLDRAAELDPGSRPIFVILHPRQRLVFQMDYAPDVAGSISN